MVLASALGVSLRAGPVMDCGGAEVCGVLTIETGLGPDVYNATGVHGLWPQVPRSMNLSAPLAATRPACPARLANRPATSA